VSPLPSDESLEAFIHRFRPIYLNKEPTNFHRVANALSEHFSHKAIAVCIRQLKRIYEMRDTSKKFAITVSGRSITSGDFLDDYLNGFEYHRDATRRTSLRAFEEKFSPEARKAILSIHLSGRYNAAVQLARLINETIDDRKDRSILIDLSKSPQAEQ
jgi:hypothetical protein